MVKADKKTVENQTAQANKRRNKTTEAEQRTNGQRLVLKPATDNEIQERRRQGKIVDKIIVYFPLC